jgi:hypothetical protein
MPVMFPHDHDDRNGRGRLLDDRGLLAAEREDHVGIEAHQFIGQLWKPLELSLRVAVLDGDGLSINVAKRFQSPKERVEESLFLLRKKQDAEPLQPCRLLGAGVERPNNR